MNQLKLDPSPIAELIPAGDGTFLIRPKKIGSTAQWKVKLPRFAIIEQIALGACKLVPIEEWITISQTAALLGISDSSVARLCETLDVEGKPFLVSSRPSPGRIVVSLESALTHKQRTMEDPEFWEKQPHRPIMERQASLPGM